MSEEWRVIPGFPAYQVSNLGNARCTTARNGRGTGVDPRAVRQRTIQGYEVVYMRKDGKTRWHKTHRLVMLAFVGPLPDGLVTRHVDGNTKNNALSNLGYCTQAENISDKHRHGTMASGERHGSRTKPERILHGDQHPMRRRPELVRRGERHSMAKINDAGVRLMRYLLAAHDAPTTDLMEWFSLTRESINNALSGRTWSHVA